MILSPMNVELTKVHYYESFRKHRNRNLQTGAWETIDNKINVDIKRNIFGQKSWTFNVNGPKKNARKIQILPVVLTACVLFAFVLSISVVAVVYIRNLQKSSKITRNSSLPSRIIVFDQSELSIEKIIAKQKLKTLAQPAATETNRNVLPEHLCQCKADEVCLRQNDGFANCKPGRDARDPSGCQGLCALNTEHCKLLDRKLRVFECAQNGGGLQCPLGYFNCQDNLCLHLESKCDGRIDCGDLSDEKNCECDLEANFQCAQNTSCHANYKRCDGKPDCWDLSDEKDCPQETFCAAGSISCSNSTGCYTSSQFCDGIVDCADRSDEICTLKT